MNKLFTARGTQSAVIPETSVVENTKRSTEITIKNNFKEGSGNNIFCPKLKEIASTNLDHDETVTKTTELPAGDLVFQ